jgi:hypothetical protein
VEEPARLADVRGQRSPLEQEERRHVAQALGVREAHWLRALVDDGDGQVVLEVAADAGPVRDHLDAVLGGVVRGADAGEHEQLRGVDGAATEDDLRLGFDLGPVAALLVLDAGGPPAVEQHPRHPRARLGGQLRPAKRRLQVGVGGAVALPVLPGHLVEAHPFLFAAVDVLGPGESDLHRRLDERLRELVGRALVGDVQRPTRPVELGVAVDFVVLGPLEVREQLLVSPPLVAVVGPVVVVGGVAADVDHRVDRAGPAEGLPRGQ